MVAGDLIDQRILEHRKAVAKSDDDIAPEVFSRLQEEAVGTLGRMLRRKLRQRAIDLVDALIGEDLINIAKAALLQGKQVSALILFITDVVDQRHEKVQLRTAPEVVGFLGTGGILNDGVCHGGHKVGVSIQPRKAVPAVRMCHIEEIDCFDIKALFPKVRRHHFKKLGLGVSHDHGLRMTAAASLRTAHEEGDNKAS